MLSVLMFWFAYHLNAPWWVFVLISLHLLRTVWSVGMRLKVIPAAFAASVHAVLDDLENQDRQASGPA